jgi:aminopeptidase N
MPSPLDRWISGPLSGSSSDFGLGRALGSQRVATVCGGMVARPSEATRSGRSRAASLRALALGLAAAVAGCAEPGLEIVEGVSLELATHRAATISEVTYAYALDIPAARDEAVTGSVAAEFVWADPTGEPLVIDFKDPAERVRALRVNGSEASWQAVHDHVVLAPEVLQSGERNRVEIEFAAGDEALNRSDDLLYTLFVPDRAHFSLPLFDQPDLKAAVRLEVEAPAEWQVVANGSRIEPEGAEAGHWTFNETRPIPTYLIAFAAGRFEVEQAERDGRVLHMYHRETDPERVASNRDEIFDLVASSVAWMESYTNIDYPFEKYDFVLLPAFQYGGMEHPGAVFYRQESLLLDASAPQSSLLGRASLIAHETAHMWFGDLVTMRWFDDVWLKEVFANFFAAKIVEPQFPDVDHAVRFLVAHYPAAYAIDRTPGANAIRQPLDNLREAGTLYGPIIYQKAPIVMRQLEARAGEATLRAALRKYLIDHAYGNATWDDLISEVAPRIPGDTPAWSAAWVDQPGRPVIEFSRVRQPDGTRRLQIEQHDAWGLGRIWPQRLSLVSLNRDINDRLRSRAVAQVRLEGATPERMPWRNQTRPPRWVLPAGAAEEYGLFVLDDVSMLNMMDDMPDILGAYDRGATWLIVEDALLDGRVAPDRVRTLLLQMLERESDQQLQGLYLRSLSDLYWRWSTDEAREDWADDLETLLWSRLEQAETVSERAQWFQSWSSIATTPESVERMRSLWARDDSIEGLPFSERDLTRLAEELALRGVANTEEILDAERERITNPDRRARFDFVRPALSNEPSVREEFFASLADPAMREREPWVLAGLRALHHPLRRAHAEQFIAPSLELLAEIQQTGDIFFPARWVAATLDPHHSARAAQTVIDYLNDHRSLPPRLRAKVLQSGDGVVRAVRIVSGERLTLPGPTAR